MKHWDSNSNNNKRRPAKVKKTDSPSHTHVGRQKAPCGSINILGPRPFRARSPTPPQRGPRHRLQHSTGTYFSHCFSDAIFPSLFMILIELWLSFPLCFTAFFVKFCTPFPDPGVAGTFYGFVWISGAEPPQKLCFYGNKTMTPTKAPNRFFFFQNTY